MSRTAYSDWMPYFGEDFESSEAVAVMSPDAEALYHRALWRQWREGSLPADVRVLRALFPAKFAERFEELWAQVAACFEERDGRLYNPRCETERSTAQEVAERRSNAGRTGGAASVEARSSKRRAIVKQSSTSAQHPTGTGTGTGTERIPTSSGAAPEPAARVSVEAPALPGLEPGPEAAPKRSSKLTPEERSEAKQAKRKSEHVQVVELWVRMWAFYRHGVPKEDVRDWTFEAPDGIPPDKRYRMQERDWVAAARLWRNCPDLEQIKRRAMNLFESDARWVREAASLALLDGKWNQFDQTIDGEAA